MNLVFLHGLESSSKGKKALWFREHFSEIMIPDFTGTLTDRMAVLGDLLSGSVDTVLVGSSFGGLMATVYAREYPEKIKKVILLAPALNFPEFTVDPGRKISVPAILYIGSRDDVCPPYNVIPAAQKTFSDIAVNVVDDDHMLGRTFTAIDWQGILSV